MLTQNDAVLLIQKALDSAPSVIGGFVVPLIDKFLGWIVSKILLFVLSAFEATGILCVLSVTRLYGDSSTSLFIFFGEWHVLSVFAPLVFHIGGGAPDDECLRSLAAAEWRLFFYFGPTVAIHSLRFFWKFRDDIAFAFLVGAWNLSFYSWRSIPQWINVSNLEKWQNKYDIDIGGLFMHAHNKLVGSFNRWEISVARRRRERTYAPQNSYNHLKLKGPRHIRLLRLKKRRFFFEPVCELIEFPLNKAPPFEAISHTWGEKTGSIPLDVDNHRILVTSEVEELLFHRRSAFSSKLFWIDSICIDQKNVDERDEQVALMREIYQRAWRVMVWLGEPENTHETYLMRKTIMALSRPKLFSFSLSRVELLERLFGKKETPFIAAGQLFKHPWFQRIWVLQEVAVGKMVHVMYKGVFFEWDTLVAAAREIGSSQELLGHLHTHLYPKATGTAMLGVGPRQSSPVDTIKRLDWPNTIVMAEVRDHIKRRNPLSLSQIMVSTTAFKSTDPRDRIFAVLGIAADRKILSFKPSYHDSTELVFLKAATFLLSCEDWFKALILTVRGHDLPTRSHLVKNLPSWVPDYTEALISAPPYGLDQHLLRDAAGKVTFTSDPRVIQLQAVDFDTVQHLGPKMTFRKFDTLLPNPDASMDILLEQLRQILDSKPRNEMRDWYLNARKLARDFSASSRVSRERADRDFWEVCLSGVEDIITEGKPSHLPYQPLSLAAQLVFERFLLTDAGEFFERIGEFLKGEKLGWEEAWVMTSYTMMMFNVTVLGKMFCITSTGSMALVPLPTREADTLVHVRGGYIPAVLRRKRPQERVAEWVGICFVHRVENVYSGSDWQDWLLE